MALAFAPTPLSAPELGSPDIVGNFSGVSEVSGISEVAGVDDVVAFLVEAVEAGVAELDPNDRIAVLGQLRNRCDSLRALALAEAAGPDARAARGLAALNDRGSTSRRDRLRDAARASVLAANPNVADLVATGDLHPAAVDALALATATATATATADDHVVATDFIDAVVGLDPDQAKRVVNRMLADRAVPEDVNDLHDRQHENRRVRPRNTIAADGTPMAALTLEGPKAVLDLWFARLEAMANARYRAAGGRDVPAGEHASFAARLFDAAGLLFNSNQIGGGAGSARADIVVTISVDGSGAAVRPGRGPIPDAVLRELVGDARIWALISDLQGQPLWLGRARRHAALAQRIALAVRDGGCVLCGVAPERCHAHHVLPWEAPGKGTTDISNLALACPSCHHDTHRRNHTMVAHPRRGWSTRPATPNELPPSQPP